MDDGTPYIVMELLEGETLSERLKRVGSLSLLETSHILTQVGKALDAAHELGIIHRDVKPGNICLLANEPPEIEVKVLDFGMAKHTALSAIESVTATGAMLGTPQYMSPEQLLDPRSVDGRSDIWALGVVAHCALLGVAPFRGETLAKLFFAISNARFVAPSSLLDHLPEALDRWFEKPLCRDANARFATAGQQASALRAIVGAMDASLAQRRSKVVIGEPDQAGVDATTVERLIEQKDPLAATQAAPPPPKASGPGGKRATAGSDSSKSGPEPKRSRPAAADMLPYPQALMADLGVGEDAVGLSPEDDSSASGSRDAPSAGNASQDNARRDKASRDAADRDVEQVDLRKGLIAVVLLVIIGLAAVSMLRNRLRTEHTPPTPASSQLDSTDNPGLRPGPD